jgi:hypothetical protein
VRRMLPGILAFAAACAALCGCGLEWWPYLEPPGIPDEALPSTPFFQVINVVVVPQELEFLGFELYYKFYSSDQASQQTSESGLTTRADLVAAHFWRMCSEGKLSEQTLPSIPLIDVDVGDRGDAFMTRVDFQLLETPKAVYYYGVPVKERDIKIRRYATDAVDDTKTFDQSELKETDVDLRSVTWTSGQYLYLVVYAFRYGLYNFTDQIYSDARYLGYVRYTIP